MLKHLCLNNNTLTHDALSFALEEKEVLEHLGISRCKLTEREILKLSISLKNVKLKTINLSYNNITNKVADALKSLFSSPSIIHVDISNCYLQEKGMLHNYSQCIKI